MGVLVKGDVKTFSSSDYNYLFNMKNGLFARWGMTKRDDPTWSPFLPEILDVEITTKCNGINGNLCPYCYKSNTPNGKNMSYATFVQIINNVNQYNQLTQVAFGLGANANENPDLPLMCDWLRSKNIIPNGTVAILDEPTADLIAAKFGSCAVSYHGDFGVTANTVKMLTDRGMNQINIHFVLAQETFAEAVSLVDLVKKEPRLRKLNCIVFLSLKQKGRAVHNVYHKLPQEHFNTLVQLALVNRVNIGFDSCSACKFEQAIQGHKNRDAIMLFVEPCESTRFSFYVNVDGMGFPCSFTEGLEAWPGYNLLEEDFQDIWRSPTISTFRNLTIERKGKCFLYDV
jgi:sulfatase maturation enzyme AslB (radical SAM superfamily)